MLYIAISIVLYALIDNAEQWYRMWRYNRKKYIVKYGLEHNGIRYKVTPI